MSLGRHMTRLLLLLVTLIKPPFQVAGVDGFLGMLNDKCDDDSFCMVIGGICDSRVQKCACRKGYVQNSLFTCVKATKLGEICVYDVQCQRRDPNSKCISTTDERYHLIYKCTCKSNYHIEVVNNVQKCIFGESAYEDKEGLTAAPIILCFMGCVVVEAFCLLAFRYWKKHRRAEFRRQGTLQLEASPLSDTRIPHHSQPGLSDTRIPHHSQPGPFLTVMIPPPAEPVISGTWTSSPPPYNQTEFVESTSVEAEEPPPSYEEAMKQCIGAPSMPRKEPSQNKRKMSC